MIKRIFNVLFVAVFAVMLGLGIVAPLMPLFAESLGATGIWLGMIFSGFSLTRALLTPVMGKLSDRWGRKSFISIGLFFYAAISLLYPLAGSVLSLTAVRLIHGIASAMVIPIAMAYVGETTAGEEAGKVMGTFSIALFLGMGTGPFIGGLLYDSYGIASVFYAMAGLTAFAFLITLLLLPDFRGSEEEKRRRDQHSIGEILGSNTMRGLITFRVTSAMRRGGVMAFLPILAARIRVTPTQIGILISLIIFITALLQRPFGKISDRYNKTILILIGSLIGTVGLALIPLAGNFGDLMVIGAVMGFGGAVALPPATAMTVLLGREVGMGATMGLFNSAMSAGMVLAPLISGAVMDAAGIESVFYVAAGISLLGTGLFTYFSRGLLTASATVYRDQT